MSTCPHCLGERGFGDIIDGWSPCTNCNGTGATICATERDLVLDSSGDIKPITGVAQLIELINQRLAQYVAIPAHLFGAPPFADNAKRCLILQDNDGIWRENWFADTYWQAQPVSSRSKFIRSADDKSLLALLHTTLGILDKLKQPVEDDFGGAVQRHVAATRSSLQKDLLMIHRELVLRMPTYFTPTSSYITIDGKRLRFSQVDALTLEDQLIKLEALIINSDHDPLNTIFPDQHQLRLTLWAKKVKRLEKELNARKPCPHKFAPDDNFKLVYRLLDCADTPPELFDPDEPVPTRAIIVCTRCGGKV